MDTVYIVETRDTRSDWTTVEAVHGSREGAEASRKHRQFIWGDDGRYVVKIREMTLND